MSTICDSLDGIISKIAEIDELFSEIEVASKDEYKAGLIGPAIRNIKTELDKLKRALCEIY